MTPVSPDVGRSKSGPYRFADIVVDAAAHSLVRGGIPQPVEPKAFAVLLELVRRPGVLIGRDQLIDDVWGTQHVTPGVLTRVIAQLRHALNDDSQNPRYIQTRHALGYCFVGELREELEGPEEPEAPVDAVLEDPDEVADANSADSPDAEPDLPVNGAREGDRRRPERRESAWQAAEPAEPRATQPHSGWKPSWSVAIASVLVVVAAALWIPKVDVNAPHAPAEASIAVMPFTSLSSNHKDDYFAEGLAEEMRDALAGVKGLKVAASISPALGKEAIDAKALGARLGVATILDASVRREASHLRISARLTDTTSGFTLWSHTYDRELAGVFATQTEIANEVVHALLGAIPGEDDALKRRLTPTRNAAAFDVYLQGLQLLHRGLQPDAVDTAVARFNKALDEDSGFARAQAGICRSEIWQFESARSADAFERAHAACDRAAQMDPSLAEVDLALGDLYRVGGDFERALQHYDKSAKTPAVARSAHVGMAQVYAAQGRHNLALDQFQQALNLSPGDAYVYSQIGYQHYIDGDIQNAISALRKALELNPDNAGVWSTLGAIYLEEGSNGDAAKALEHSIAIDPSATALSNLGLLKYQAGDYKEAAALQRQSITANPQDFMIWANLGDSLRADDTANAKEIRDVYRQAATRAVRYLQLKPDDASVVAYLGLFQMILGDPDEAQKLIKRSEALGGQSGEVALLNAETLALLGEIDAARQRLADARAAGTTPILIESNATFRRLGLLSPGRVGKSSERPESTAPSAQGHLPGG